MSTKAKPNKSSEKAFSGSAVLDNSMVLAILMPDEQDPTAEKIKSHLHQLQLFAPCHWPLEFANALNTNIRRKRITVQEANAYCRVVALWEIAIDTQVHAPIAISQLARDTGLTTYDAAYLELSRRLNAPLFSLDIQLAKAASI